MRKSEGPSVTVTLSRDEPPTGDPWSGATAFTGTRNNDEITASYQAPGVPFACSTDTSFTYGEAGELEAVVSGSRISGQYTVTYGAGDSQATYVFQFQASL